MALKKGVNKPTPVESEEAEVVETPEAEAPAAEVVEEPAAEASNEPEVEAEPTVDSGPEVSEAKGVVAAQSTAPSTSPNRRAVGTPGAGQSFEEQAADEGMDGLELGYGSFPNVKLDDGEFVDGDGNSYPDPFYFTPIASRAVLAFSQKNEEDGDVFFSYDGITTTKGESVAELTDEWKEDGYEPVKDTRLEVDCLLKVEEDGEYVEGEMVMLSLPPTARKKFSGKFAMAKRLYTNKGLAADDIVMQANIGKSVKVGTRSFKPWLFGFVKP